MDFNQVAFREALEKSFILHEYPFQYVDHEEIRKVFAFLNFEVRYITRNTGKADILKLFSKEKEKLQLLMRSARSGKDLFDIRYVELS